MPERKIKGNDKKMFFQLTVNARIYLVKSTGKESEHFLYDGYLLIYFTMMQFLQFRTTDVGS